MSAALKTAKKARVEDFVGQAEEHFARNPTKLFIPNASNGLAQGNTLGFRYASMEHAFPDVNPGVRPLGSLVLVQIRAALDRVGSLLIVSDTRQTEQDNTQVAKVIACGPLAFKNRNTGDDWPEGAWVQVGEYVRVPKYRGDRFTKQYRTPELKFEDGKWVESKTKVTDEVTFAMFNDLALLGVYTEDPLQVRSFL